VAFKRRLGESIGSPGRDVAPRRTVGKLVAAAEEEREREQRRRAAEAEAKRVAEMEALAAREPQTWRDVDALIQEGKAKSYERAVGLLARLKELAAYRDQEDAFQKRLNQIYDQYARRTALLRRLHDAGLTEG
jgi:predicted NodU family carbamoyl transferase